MLQGTVKPVTSDRTVNYVPRVTAPERRESILAAAREVFLESGRDGARTKEIADRAGINEALIYRHFRSKDELFTEAIVEPLVATIRRYMGRHREGTRIDIADARRTTYHSIAAMHREMRQLAPSLLVLLAGEDGLTAYAEHVAPLLAESRGDIQTALRGLPHRDVDARLLATITFATTFFYGLDEHFGGEGEAPELLAERLTDLIFEGLERRPPE
jgi:AcrR family transcriptional regulator